MTSSDHSDRDDDGDRNRHHRRSVNLGAPRSFGSVLKYCSLETFFPDDPFCALKYETSRRRRAAEVVRYFVPICRWLPDYTFRVFTCDLLAGVTIASLAIPQGISYAELAQIPPVVGLYSSFVPPMIYAVFGSSKHLAVGTVAACSLLLAATVEEVASPVHQKDLFLNLVFTATLFAGFTQFLLGILRLGILVDFLSHSTITGFMGGTAVIISLQQMKGILGLKHFTTKTSVVEVLKAIFKNRQEWNWKCFVAGLIFLVVLQTTRFVKKKRPMLFWVSAIGPMLVVVSGCIFSYFAQAEKHGFPIVGHLKKGINESSIGRYNFNSKYLLTSVKAGVITGLIALVEGIAVGRSFALSSNEQIDGNKEMVAYGLMNIIGSMTSCYLTTGPFSKTAVNVNAGCRTPMTNVVQAICMLMVLLFLAPLFSYTPQVALSAIIVSAMLGLIKYKEAYRLFKTDKFDFLICMSAFLGVSFISMDVGLVISVGLALTRGMLYIARPSSCKLGKLPGNVILYRDVEQYPEAAGGDEAGFLVLQLGSPIYFANANYVKERILRWVREEQGLKNPCKDKVKYVLLDLGGVTAIDSTGLESLFEVHRRLENEGIKMLLINPRIEVTEKLMVTKFIDKIGVDAVFLSLEEAIESCSYST
ncbi:probable sulfate transporter 3.5 [Andrographis paniculata]|uniref:probable sulfate transporter 3.5 n=1 Tax=Andrographis paniculata TaxID=175694 RepID=UPI0021E85AA8|nr:probable sulfate transporter 3.5 [Andrographis paniculata]